tara:strand:+ start:2916 stop:4283 length:1368 start_codon:yes stop_codon:yes gene_type:complete
MEELKLKGKIGLEVHVYVVTKEKLFCQCRASREKGLKPNSNICPICVGQPGAKPILPNKSAIEKAVQIGLMLGCKINHGLVWQRKHYDWPDMPKGYQNTLSGAKAIPVGVNGKFLGVEIWSMHLEEDPAAWDPNSGRVDYNRSGLPLVEIITGPDFKTGEEVVLWLRKLVHSLSYLKAADTNAGIKVDTNVNIPGKTERVEIKNISSVEDIGKAIGFELERQLEEGSTKETRRFDSVKGKTMVMREKEGAEDYRFISDPDLQEIIISKEFVSSLERGLPESPDEKLERFIKAHKIGKEDAAVLTKHVDIAEFFEKVAEKVDARFALRWVTVELLRHLNYHKTSLGEVDIAVEDFVGLLKMVQSGKITELQGKQLLNRFYPKSFNPEKKAEKKIDSEKELEKVIEKVVEENGKAVSDFKAGDKKALNFLMGRVMAKTSGRADFKVVRRLLEKVLKS